MGLLVGDRSRSVARVMTCLTISPTVVDEAVEQRADLVVTHHPLPFKPHARITSDSVSGGLLLRLIEARTAIYSAHTAFDSALEGINELWAQRLGLVGIEPLVRPPATPSTFASDAAVMHPTPDRSEPDQPGPVSQLGPVPGEAGRSGRVAGPITLQQFVRQAAALVAAPSPRYVGAADQPVRKVAIACGSGGSFLAAARRRGCDTLLTGEATFHNCLDAESLGIGLGLLGHYWSERFALEQLAEQLTGQLPDLTIWPSQRESDPLRPLDS